MFVSQDDGVFPLRSDGIGAFRGVGGNQLEELSPALGAHGLHVAALR